MDINGANGPTNGMGAGVLPRAPQSSNANRMSIGDQLNSMSGINTEKNIYGEKQTLDKDAFLKMFMEQLKYQDPLKPQSSDQFTSQMAMFSQLEQTLETNKHLQKMVSQQNNSQIAALQLVGKNITADRSGLYHDKGKITPMTFSISNDMSDMKIEIVDPAGEVAKTYAIGERNAGTVNWKWDGTRDNGAPAETGKYSYRVSGKGMDGKIETINTKTDGRVSGVTSSNGIVYLLIGDQKIALSDVETIKDPNSTDANQTASKPAVFKPAGNLSNTGAGGAQSDVSGTPPAPEGSIAGASDSFGSQGAGESSTGSVGTNTESTNSNGRMANSNDDTTSQNWDRLNPLMPLNLR